MRSSLLVSCAALTVLAACGSSTSHGSGSGSGTGSGAATSSSAGSGGSTTGTGGAGGASSASSSSTSTGASSSSSSSAVGSGGGDAGAPTFLYEFVTGDASAFYQEHPYGSVTFGKADPGARDGKAAALLFKAGTTAVGPGGKATEIGTLSKQRFGEYRFRVRLATCQPTEELVNGLFVYQNDGQDHDGDGLVDNDEIDIEILCAQPGFINLTSWTEYTDDTHMRKKSRIIDLDTGTIYVGVTDGYGIDQSDPQNGTHDPTLAHPGWYDPTAYYEMGWDWQADHIRWFMVLGGAEVTLWTLTDTTRIPQHDAAMIFNLWYPGTHWNEDGTVMPIKSDATLSADWLSFTAGK